VRAHTGWSSEMRSIDVQRSSIVVYRVEIDRARIDSLVIGAWILGIRGRGSLTWHEHARCLVPEGRNKNFRQESVRTRPSPGR